MIQGIIYHKKGTKLCDIHYYLITLITPFFVPQGGWSVTVELFRDLLW